MENKFDYQKLLDYIDHFNGEKIHNLFVLVEDDDSLVLDLDNGYIYFTIEEKNKKYVLTYRKFDSKLNPRSETRMTLESLTDLISKIHNIVIYNCNKKPRKK